MSTKSPQAHQIKQLKKHRRKVLTSLVTRAYLLHRKGQRAEMNSLICEEFTKLGGVYVKFLQGVLLKSAFMRDWQTSDKLKIFEDLDSEPLDVNVVLRHELNAQQFAAFAAINPAPFAAGSFGQVYFANLTDGSQVIVKVLRPMIRETLAYDLKLINFFFRAFINKVYRNMDFNIGGALQDFRRATMRETDYVEEARFGNELYQAYQGQNDFVIPRTYTELCTPNIIVQEYIDGISCAQLLRLKEQGFDIEEYVKYHFNSDLKQQLKLVGFEYIRGIFMLPRVQGDPHPGNVKILPNNRVALIDFGISAQSPKEKAAFYGVLREYERVLRGELDIPMLLGQFLRFFVSDLYRAMKKITTMLPASDKSNDLTRQMGLVAEANFKKEMSGDDLSTIIENGNILSTLNQVVNSGNRFGVVVKVEDSEMLRAAQSYITLVDSLGLKSAVLPQAFQQGLEYVGKERPEFTQETESTMSLNRSLEIISKWLERVATRDPGLFKIFISKIRMLEETKPKVAKSAPSSDESKSIT